MTWLAQDMLWMTRALELAARGRFTTWPNPMVGCVVVRDDSLLAEGWHRKHGEGHAEVNALAQLDPGLDLSQATAYVTLEPCSHKGKTPPCADLLVSRGVGRVGVAMTDLMTALYAHGAVLAALLQRGQTGRGQKIDCNLLSSQVSAMSHLAGNWLNAGLVSQRWGTAHASIVPYQTFQSSDGHFTIGCGNDK